MTPWTPNAAMPGYEIRYNAEGCIETRPTTSTLRALVLGAGFLEQLLKTSEDAESILLDCGRLRLQRAMLAAVELYLKETK